MESAFSQDQIERYLDYISFPDRLRRTEQPRDYELLRALHIYQISTFPYENLSLHYNPAHANSLDPHRIYDKFLNGHGRGGFCLETGVFMREILRGMGFRTFVAGAKIRLRDPNGVPGGDFVSWVHCVNVVTLSNGSRYHVDVGFGGDGPTSPLPLDSVTAVHNLGTQEVRVTRDRLPGSSPQENHLWWIYQYRNASERAWLSYYAFPECEFSQADLDFQNYWVCNNDGSPQSGHVILAKFIRGEGRLGEAEIVSKRTLFDATIKENMGGKTKLVQVCKNEGERVEAISRLFSLTLTEEQVNAMQGWRTELTEATSG